MSQTKERNYRKRPKTNIVYNSRKFGAILFGQGRCTLDARSLFSVKANYSLFSPDHDVWCGWKLACSVEILGEVFSLRRLPTVMTKEKQL